MMNDSSRLCNFITVTVGCQMLEQSLSDLWLAACNNLLLHEKRYWLWKQDSIIGSCGLEDFAEGPSPGLVLGLQRDHGFFSKCPTQLSAYLRNQRATFPLETKIFVVGSIEDVILILAFLNLILT